MVEPTSGSAKPTSGSVKPRGGQVKERSGLAGPRRGLVEARIGWVEARIGLVGPAPLGQPPARGSTLGGPSRRAARGLTAAILRLCLQTMGIAERDYILRMIQRVAETIGAILRKRSEGKTDEALALLERARADLFGGMRSALDALDPGSVDRLLTETEKVRAYATFLAVEADLRDDRAEARAAAAARRRSLSVLLELAAARKGELREADREAIASLAAKVEASRLSERQRETLAALQGGAAR